MAKPNLFDAAKNYIDRIVSHKSLRKDSNVGKVLLLDAFTTQVVANVYSQTEIMDKDFYLVEQLGATHEPMPHMKAALYVRPTADNVDLLCQELRDPKFKEYHLFFSNILDKNHLRMIADADEHDLVQQVQEFYGDFVAVSEELFTLNQRNSLLMCGGSGADMRAGFNAATDALLSVLLATKSQPRDIRFQQSSTMAKQMASEVSRRIEADGIFHFNRDGGPTVLILDRLDDPVTPLLSQWTYQAMVHELLGIHSNRVVLKGAPGIKADLEEVVLAPAQDSFFRTHRYSNYGDLGEAIKTLLQDYQRQARLNDNISSVEDMQAFMERYPAFRSQSHNVSKHVALMSELSRLIEVCNLMDVSQLEQELACNDDHAAQLRELMVKIRGSSTKAADKLRLALLYCLRYEDQASVQTLKQELIDGGVPHDKIPLIDQMLKYAGQKKRTPGLYGGRTFMSRMAKNFQSGLAGVENVYTQHIPLMMTTIEAAVKGKLKPQHYPSISGSTAGGVAASGGPQSVIVFVIGGVTFEEALKVSELNASSPNSVLLGGTAIHNSATFLAELKQM